MTAPLPAVFDCTIFAQALINPAGPAGACLTAAQRGQVQVFVTDYVLGEIRELPAKLPAKLGVTAERVDRLILDLAKYTQPVETSPPISPTTATRTTPPTSTWRPRQMPDSSSRATGTCWI